MRKTLLLASVLLGLGAFTFWYLQQKPENTSIARWDTNFAVDNINDIYKVFMANRKGETILLERKADHWVYNEKFRVRPGKIKNLLESINRQRVKYIPPKAAVKTAIESIATVGIKVEIYDKNDEKLKVFYVGGTTSNGTGTYMIMEDSEEPIVMHIPFWEGSLRGRYWELPDAWKDRAVFRHELEEIESVAVEYPRHKNKSFILERKDNDYTVRPFYDITPPNTGRMVNGSAERYLTGFKALVAEGFRNTFSKRDSINQLVPFSIVTLKDRKGETVEARFFPQRVVETNNAPDGKSPLPIEAAGKGIIERYFADCSDGNFMLVQHRVFGKIFWDYNAFFDQR
ncbi:MAG: DUF4340 domain-containing protein [Bacteroidota bacterium]